MSADTVGGVWTFAMELAEALGQDHVEVMLASLGGLPTRAQQRQAQAIPRLRLIASKFKLEWMDNPWDDVAKSGRWLLDLEREFSPDLVHLNSFGHGALPWKAPVILTAHSCVASWWAAVKQQPLPVEWRRYRHAVEQSLLSVHRFVAPSQSMLTALRQNYCVPLDPSRGTVIANGRLRARFHCAEKEPFIFSAGRLWDGAKNIAAVVRAARHLPWPVYLAGSCERARGEPADTSGCCLLGQLSSEDLAWCYARAPIYVLPAYYEPFGLSVLEAALSGCALVLGDIDSLREAWDGAACFVPPGDTGMLTAALQRMIADPRLRGNLARRSFARARQFTPERMASAYLAVYRAALKESYACAS